MRIAMLSWESLHSIAVGGVGTHVTELAAALERKGHEIHIFTRRAQGQRPLDRIDGVRYHRVVYPGHHDFVDDVNNMCRAFVDRLFDVEDLVGHFEVVHAHDWLAANAMIWIKQGRGHRCVLTIHATEYARCGNATHNGRSQRIRDQERAGTYWADRVIAVSHATKREIQSMYEVPDWKIQVVYNGVSPHRFAGRIDPGEVKRRYRIGPTDPTILFCGRLTQQKGPDLLIEAIPFILKYYGRAKFIFAGDGELRGALENRARQLRIWDAVRFLGFRNGEELVNLFKACEAACVPSRNEPFGIVILEAWSAGKPVIVTRNGGPDEYVQHGLNGLKIHPTVDSVAWGIGTLFADFDRGRWMGQNGQRLVAEQFTWDKIAKQTLDAYPSEPLGAQPAAQAAATVGEAGEVDEPAGQPAAQPAAAAGVTQTAAETPKASQPAAQPAPPIQAVRPAGPRVILELSFGQGSPDVSTRRQLEVRRWAGGVLGLSVRRRGDRLLLEGEWSTVMSALRHFHEHSNGLPLAVTVRRPAASDSPVAAHPARMDRLLAPAGGYDAEAMRAAAMPPGAMERALADALAVGSSDGGGHGDR